MKQQFTSPMLTPKYVTQFQCAGGDCPDTCCMGWTISVDRDTFQDYRRVTHPTLKPLIKTHLVQLDKDSIANHGKFNLASSGSHCGMQTTQGLCGIQQNLGEDALSDTCYIYPRTVFKVTDRFEQCLTLSCPEAARLALTQDDAFEFVSTEFTTRQSTTSELASLHGFDTLAMDEVRVFCIQLFQTEELSNTDRLVLLGWLCSQLDELIATHCQANVLDLVSQLRELVESGGFRSVVTELSSYPKLAAQVFSILFGSPVGKGSSANQLEVVGWVTKGLGFDANGQADPSVLEENYLRGLGHLNANTALLEKTYSRYLLNDLLREVFPWGKSSPMGHFRRLLTRFGILRLMLVAAAAARSGPLDQSTVVQVTQVFCRLYQHNEVFATQADHILTGSDWDTIDRLYTLL
jgi:lysine-N-methylase